MRLALALLLLALPSCRLVDQRTFGSTAQPPGAAALARPDLPPLPLLTVRFTNPGVDWRTSVDEAVQAALTRKPTVAFEVVTPIPTSASREVQDAYARNGREDAAAVAQEIQAAGIPPERITLAQRGDPGQPPREVRLYAR